MGLLDKVVSAVTPEPSIDDMLRVRADARAQAGGSGWLSMVIDHHEQVEALFEAVKSAPTASAQTAAQKKLALLLTAHSIAEEGVLYPAMALTDQKSHSAEAYTEQSAAKVQIAALDDLQPMSTDYLDKLEHLRAAVAHHVYEEEKEWFPKLRSIDNAVLQTRLTKKYRDEFQRYLGTDVGAFEH